MTLLATRTSASDDEPKPSLLERILNEARKRIEVKDVELDEARRRRSIMCRALEIEFGGRTFVNGSIAHGDALNPLTDVDLGVVEPNVDGLYGPSGKGPAELQERAARAVRVALEDDFPNLRIEWRNRKRSILVRFGDPVTPGEKDFTADVIVALDPPDLRGLFIPRNETWDRSAPETHTAMIKASNELTRSTFARVVRLVKHWARTHDRPLCSWNIKALALDVLVEEVTMLEGLRLWFGYAADELSNHETPDPARVAAEPIHIPDGWERRDVVTELRNASIGLARAVRFEEEGYPALAIDELAKVFRDPQMMPGPDPKQLATEIAKRAQAAAASVVPTAVTSDKPSPNRRAWSC